MPVQYIASQNSFALQSWFSTHKVLIIITNIYIYIYLSSLIINQFVQVYDFFSQLEYIVIVMLMLQKLKCNMLQYIILLYKALTGASDMISNIEGGV